MDDGWELDYGLDPLVDDSLGNDDDDCLLDGEEINLNETDPLSDDSDGNGFLDGHEEAAGSDPNNPNNCCK